MAGLTGLSPLSRVAPYFPPDAVGGQTGEEAQRAQGQALERQDLTLKAKNRNILRPYDAETEPAPYQFDEFDDEFVLPGSMNPDKTPRTHSVPFAGWAGNYEGDPALAELNANIDEIHSQDFGALIPRIHSAKWATGQEPYDIWYDESAGQNQLQPIKGQLQNMGGYDATQGCGGGGSGPGGINPESPGHGKRTLFTQAQPTYSLDPAERPFIVPQGGVNAIFTDEVQGPSSEYGWGYGDGASPYHSPSAYEPPADPALFTSSYTEGPIV